MCGLERHLTLSRVSVGVLHGLASILVQPTGEPAEVDRSCRRQEMPVVQCGGRSFTIRYTICRRTLCVISLLVSMLRCSLFFETSITLFPHMCPVSVRHTQDSIAVVVHSGMTALTFIVVDCSGCSVCCKCFTHRYQVIVWLSVHG